MKNLILQKQLVKMFNMKRIFFLTFFMVAIIAISGCTSQNKAGDSQNTESSLKNTSLNQNSNLAPINEGNPIYEAWGRCYHVVDGDTIEGY